MINLNYEVMDARKEVKILLSKKAWTMKRLAEKLSEMSGKYYSPQNLNYRLRTNSLKLAEMDCICKILGFKITFEDISK
ncbi:TPA: hypothetical protein IAC10_05495 [Candidatus Scatousia excrementigallinarum]|uniref:Uncharacterized protein n=1 Tax=Candidatus Scatousia excrementigallinarum TaxID=2840935 RepID=A0A9D1EYA5_9BACT|nr:hypothetical protein [Candidatus Scatousia excrementigallinarum]